MNKPLQNYIEEEMEKIRKELVFPYTRPPMVSKEGIEIMPIYQGSDVKRIEEKISQSLHRIAEITAREIVPEKKNIKYPSGFDAIDTDTSTIVPNKGYNQAISDLQTKIKEFGI